MSKDDLANFILGLAAILVVIILIYFSININTIKNECIRSGEVSARCFFLTGGL